MCYQFKPLPAKLYLFSSWDSSTSFLFLLPELEDYFKLLFGIEEHLLKFLLISNGINVEFADLVSYSRPQDAYTWDIDLKRWVKCNGDWAGSIPNTLKGVFVVEIIQFLGFLGKKG